MASRVNRLARGMRLGSFDAYLGLAIEAASNAEQTAGVDLLTDEDRKRLTDAIDALAGIAQQLWHSIEKERKGVRRG